MNAKFENAHPATNVRPSVFVIAGSDSSGLAGIQRDNQTINALGCHALNVISANTAQNQHGVQAIHPVNDLIFTKQLNINSQRDIAAIKIGLITSARQIEAVLSCLQTIKAPVVFDPVLAATSGEQFYSRQDTFALLNAMRSLLPFCDIITPNLEEAQKLCEFEIDSEHDIPRAAQILHSLGAKSVLIKGGHRISLKQDNTEASVRDYFCSKEHSFWLRSERQDTQNTRGTGCALASSIASALALGYSIEDACVIAKMAINQGLEHAYTLAEQAGPVFINQFPSSQKHLPQLIKPNVLRQDKYYDASKPPNLPNGDAAPLGLYPVVDSADWLARLLPLGISTIQLRVKNLVGEPLKVEIQKSIALAQQYNCRLFINDYWELAIALGAYGIHLGQEDLDDADIAAIKSAGLRLGISTHCHYEVARAHFYRPSYIACGPVYHTDTKQMAWVPHGTKGFAYWRRVLNYPLVAIGGINQERLPDVIAQKPDGTAMITAITLAPNPERITRTFLELITRQTNAAI